MPLLCVYALNSLALSDAVSAAASLPPGSLDAAWTVRVVAAFGFLSIGMGGAFLWLRSGLSLKVAADYFDSDRDVYRLLRDEDVKPLRREPGPALRWWRDLLHWLTPRTLPLLALGLMVLLRAALALMPELAEGAPAALALLSLTLTWWLCVFGALGLAEVAHGRPYILFLAVWIGLLSLLQQGDNHVLPLLPPAGDAASLTTLRLHNATMSALLAAVAATLWWLFTKPVETNWLSDKLLHWHRPACVALAAVLVLAALRFFDRYAPVAELSTHSPAVVARLPSRPRLTEALSVWKGELPPAAEPAQDRVFLVASEGGGIRSAYWTAQVLRRLRAWQPDFDRRTFVMSGASGGAVGIVAYRACVREVGEDGTDTALQGCLSQRFWQLDALSPLLAAWIFEDGFARLLPVPMSAGTEGSAWKCRLPACGHLSRALGFEREWMRAFPALAQPLTQRRAGEPHLLLNATWIETGELATVSTLAITEADFPGTRDVQARLGRELSLIGGAHVAARFPFTNPLAAVLPASCTSASPERGARTDGETHAKTTNPLATVLPASGKSVSPERECLTESETDAKASASTEGVVGHLGDGGYFDNSATLGLAPVWRMWRRDHGLDRSRQWVVVLIRNGQKPPRCAQDDPHGPPVECVVPKRRALANADDLDVPTRRRNWSLYANVMGPLIAVLNVSGIGAHGRRAAADLRAEIGVASPARAAADVMLIDQLDKGTLVPLGWYLSPTAREALNAQSDCLALELRGIHLAERPAHCR